MAEDSSPDPETQQYDEAYWAELRELGIARGEAATFEEVEQKQLPLGLAAIYFRRAS